MVSLSKQLVALGATECSTPNALVADALCIYRWSERQTRQKQILAELEEIVKKLEAGEVLFGAVCGRLLQLEHEAYVLCYSQQATPQT